MNTKKILTAIIWGLVSLLIYWGFLELSVLLPYSQVKWAEIPTWYKPLHLAILLVTWLILYYIITYWWRIWIDIND